MGGIHKENRFFCTFQPSPTILLHHCAFIFVSKALYPIDCVYTNVFSFPMSFHRVLPLLPSLSNEALRYRWATKPDPLLSSKIMPNDSNTEEATPRDNELPKAVSPPEHQGPSPAAEEVENYQSPQYPGSSLSQTSDAHARSRPPKTIEKTSSDEALDRWQGESPSSICLCQPDPKVPRPRNGTCVYICL